MPESAVNNETERLRRAVEELSILNDLARAIGGSHNSQEIMQTIIRRSLRAIKAAQGVITLVDESEDQSMQTLVRTMVSSEHHGAYHMNQSILGWMYLNKKPLVVNDAARDERFRGVKWEDSISTLICVPMIVKSKLIGLLTLYNKKDPGGFTDGDQRLLAIIAAQSAQVVENARLYEEEQRLQKMQEELRLASRIQLDLLPKSMPALEGYDIAAKTLPAQEVGGDYFDFITLDEKTWAFVLGDVSGKGLPASLLMANLQATLRGQTILSVSPNECIRKSNKLLFFSTSPEKFATLFLGILDITNHQLRYTNAGHDGPFLLGSGAASDRLQVGGVPLGMLDDFPYEEGTARLGPGGVLVAYSDGVSEAWNTSEEEFGEKRIAEVIQSHRDKSAAEIIDSIISAVRNHAGAAPQADDITLVVIKRVSS